MLHVLDRFRTT